MRGRLFRKYVAAVAGIVLVALVTNGAMEAWATWRDHQAALVRIQREQAEAAAEKIGQFVSEIERQLGWTTQLPWSDGTVDQRRFDAQRLLRQVPAVTELAQIDGAGRERLRVSRLAMDVLDSGRDLSAEPSFTEAVAGKVYYGPVYFRRESEPYMTLAVAGTRRSAGVTAAEVNLKFIWDVVLRIRVGERGLAYVIDRQDRLIAHPDIGLVLRQTDMSGFAQVRAGREGASADLLREAIDLQGRRVLSASARVAPLGWQVFVELPVAEANAPLYAAIRRIGVILLVTLGLAIAAGMLLARRMVAPIRALGEGAARFGQGELGQRIDVRTGDELEALAGGFNDMAARLQESYSGLERKIAERTRELTESLERQTATAEVLKVMSRSQSELQPVLETIAATSVRLCRADYVHIYTLAPDGNYYLVAGKGVEEDYSRPLYGLPFGASRGSLAGRAALERQAVHIPNIPEDPDYTLRIGKQRTGLGVPLMRGQDAIGVIVLVRTTVNPFTDAQIELVTSFADQAVIAIENVRLFTELEARTRELTETLEQQTATSEILRAISTSMTDAQPVFETIVRNAVSLCGSLFANVFCFDGELLHFVASHNAGSGYVELLGGKYPMRPDRSQVSGRVVLTKAVVRLEDAHSDPDYDQRFPPAMGWRRMLGVPLLREGEPLGVIVVGWAESGPVSKRQEELLETFANQAVIAIENVRLFDEVQARTRELGRSVEELRALDEVSQAVGSSLDLETVLATIVSRAVALSGGYGGIVYEFEEADQTFHARAAHRISGEHLDALRAAPVRMGEGAVGRAGLKRRPVEVSDIGTQGHLVAPQVRAILAREGMRALLAIPLVREERILGGLVILRKDPGAFPAKVVGLLRTFGAHSVLAIQNARLFREIEEKGRELAEASKHKSQFLANMSHELRTPLNAILGYTELILDGIYGEAPEKMQGVLERVHSNGRHLLGLINDVLDLSKIEAGQLTLSLADYSLADLLQSVQGIAEPLAAEKGLNFRIEVPQDVPVGRGDERRLAQVFLNLVGNAIKFTDVGEVVIEAQTADATFRVAVHDTGPGISAADQEKIFGEFQQADSSSTRKKGGTGLGLSISRRIVEMHGGQIDLESEPGQGATFTVTLPVSVERQVGSP